MPIYYLTFRVTPSLANVHFNEVAGAIAACWVRDDNVTSAFAKASFAVRRSDWIIVSMEDPPVETTRQDFSKKDIGQEEYDLGEAGVRPTHFTNGLFLLPGVEDYRQAAIDEVVRMRKTVDGVHPTAVALSLCPRALCGEDSFGVFR